MTAGPVRHQDLDLCLEAPGRPLTLLFLRGKAAECSTPTSSRHGCSVTDCCKVQCLQYLVPHGLATLRTVLATSKYMLAAFPATAKQARSHARGGLAIYSQCIRHCGRVRTGALVMAANTQTRCRPSSDGSTCAPSR